MRDVNRVPHVVESVVCFDWRCYLCKGVSPSNSFELLVDRCAAAYFSGF